MFWTNQYIGLTLSFIEIILFGEMHLKFDSAMSLFKAYLTERSNLTLLASVVGVAYGLFTSLTDDTETLIFIPVMILVDSFIFFGTLFVVQV
jgi:flagellar biosynthesis protein FliQ